MMRPTMVDLFCGTKSSSNAAKELGYDVWTLDLDPEDKFSPDMRADILMVELEDLPERFRHPDVVWASPPCQKFSVTQIGRNWRMTEDGQHLPRNKEAELALTLVAKALMLIKEMRPAVFYLENPRDKLRSLPMMQPQYLSQFFGFPVVRRTAYYCQYWEKEKVIRPQKPTDLWTNNLSWNPRPTCSPGDPCHSPAPRGSKQGVQGQKGAAERGIVPHDLCLEMIASCRKETPKGWF